MSQKILPNPKATSTPNPIYRPPCRPPIGDKNDSVASPITGDKSKTRDAKDLSNSLLAAENEEHYQHSQDVYFNDRETSSPKRLRIPENAGNISGMRGNISNRETQEELLNKSPSRSRSPSVEDLSLLNFNRNNDYEIRETVPNNASQKPENYFFTVIFVIFAVCIVIVAANLGINSRIDFDEKIGDIKKSFANQEADFWINVEVAIKEIKAINQPKTVMFVYTKNAETTMNSILKSLSELATCYITDCLEKPIIIQGESLNSTEFLEDYGKLIELHENSLTEKGVMVVEHLEKVPGTVAQAFHSFCDEYNPVVQKALFLFTVQVDSLDTNIEHYLLKIWNDIPMDNKFYPLYTRISSTVLSVRPER